MVLLAGCARPVAKAPEGLTIVASACTAERLQLYGNRNGAVAVQCMSGRCTEEAIGPGELTAAAVSPAGADVVVDGRVLHADDALTNWRDLDAPARIAGLSRGAALYAWSARDVFAWNGAWTRLEGGPIAGGVADPKEGLLAWQHHGFDSTVTRPGANAGVPVPSTGDLTVAGAFGANGTAWLLGLTRENTLVVHRGETVVLRVPLTVPRTLQVAGAAIVVGARGGDVHSESMLFVSRDDGATWQTVALPVRVATALCAADDGTLWTVDALGHVYRSKW